MIRRLAARAAAVDLPLLVLATAGSASIVTGWALAVAAWTVPTGIPPVTLAMVALLPLCGVVSLLMSFALPRPVRMAGRTVPVEPAPAGAPGARRPPLVEGSGAGAATPSLVSTGWAGPPRVHAPIVFRPGRATVGGGAA